MEIRNAQLAEKVVKKFLSQSFGENVSKLLMRRGVDDCKEAYLNFITNNVTVNLNVFGVLVKDRVVSDM